jgi:tRNA threonylcarbamoyl adenosine modification protein (Sua5/YciO/YrdC/YwlC family)
MLLTIYPDNPNPRHIETAVECLKNDGVVIIPTDTVYALACNIHSSKAFERICRLKGVKPQKANFSFLCGDLSNISDYTKPFSREVFRVMKNSLPGPFTFILLANNHVPSIFRSNKKTIGIRVPDNNIPQAIVSGLGNPLMVTSVHDDDEILDYTTDPQVIHEKFGNDVDLVIDGGYSEFQPSTIIDCTGSEPIVVREGKGIVR